MTTEGVPKLVVVFPDDQLLINHVSLLSNSPCNQEIVTCFSDPVHLFFTKKLMLYLGIAMPQITKKGVHPVLQAYNAFTNLPAQKGD